MKNRLVVLFLCIPFFILASGMFYALHFVRTAQEVVLPIQGYDPRNILSGHYIRFQINWEQADCHQAGWNGVCPVYDFAGVNTYYIPENQAYSLERNLQSEDNKMEVVFAYESERRPIPKELRMNGRTLLQSR